MTEAYRVTTDYVLNKWDADLFEQDRTSNIDHEHDRYVDNLKVFYLNPDKLIKRRTQILEQFELSGIPSKLIERVEPTKYPCIADYTLKNNIISWDHISMWQKAYDQKCDGAFFFEDDVYFLKNWKTLVQDIFDKYGRDKTHIIRFDSAPLISVEDIPDDKVAVFHPQAFACVGGYYMSRDAITTSLNIVKTRPWTWTTIETLVGDIMKDYFKTMSYETSPRICVQNWFLGDGSALQKDDHMKRLKDVMCNGYLQRYHTRYQFNTEIKAKLVEIFKDYTVYNYIEKVLE